MAACRLKAHDGVDKNRRDAFDTFERSIELDWCHERQALAGESTALCKANNATLAWRTTIDIVGLQTSFDLVPYLIEFSAPTRQCTESPLDIE